MATSKPRLDSASTACTRRKFIQSAAATIVGLRASDVYGAVGIRHPKMMDIRIDRVTFAFEDYRYRAPVKFAGVLMDRATLLTVECGVRTRTAKVATGIASMPFNHIFSYPSKALSHDAKNSAMKALAAELARVTGTHTEYSDPIDLNWSLAPAYLEAAAAVSD